LTKASIDGQIDDLCHFGYNFAKLTPQKMATQTTATAGKVITNNNYYPCMHDDSLHTNM
jgi:hypothetical protein